MHGRKNRDVILKNGREEEETIKGINKSSDAQSWVGRWGGQ